MRKITVAYPDRALSKSDPFLALQNMGYEVSYLPFSIDNGKLTPLSFTVNNESTKTDAVICICPNIGSYFEIRNAISSMLDQQGVIAYTLFIPVITERSLQSITGAETVNEVLYLDDPELVIKIDTMVSRHISENSNSSSSSFPGSPPGAEPMPISPESVSPERSDDEESYSSAKYWLLKINPHTWNIDSFKIGYQAYFNIYYANNTRRIDHENFQRIKKGDKIIGFAYFEKKTIECIFEVTKGEHALQTGGDGISMMITRVFQPAVSYDLASDLLPPEDKLEGDAPERLFSVTKKSFNAIIGLIEDFVVRRQQYISSYTTEGNHAETEDRLAFMHDIESFGSVMCLKTVRPPLAIALFGRWGSGKSFFMQKLADYINTLTSSKDERYVQHIVQVKFNSWHYSDANLWASIITDIFDELNNYAMMEGKEDEIKKLSDSLQLTGLQKEAEEQKKKELEEKISTLRQVKKDEGSKLEYLLSIRELKKAFTEKNIKQLLSSLNDHDIDQLIVNEKKLEGYLGQVQSTASKLKILFSELRQAKGRWWLLAAVVLAVALGAGFWAAGGLLPWNSVKVFLLAELTPIVIIARKIAKAAKTSAGVLSDIVSKLSNVKSKLEANGGQKAVLVSEVDGNLADVKSNLAALDKKITATQKQIDDISSGKKLMDFINTRSRDESYARQLGLISLIRKDFETLDKLLREQHQVAADKKAEIGNKAGVSLRIDRIILYIDDLDRCSEDIVVKVLEAIHLLLAFPLFVVVVGVDPRWLNNALNKKYGSLFYHQQGHESVSEELKVIEPITSYDYLEKIFQIPFALKQADSHDRRHLLRYLLRDEILNEEKSIANIHAKPKNDKVPNPGIVGITGGSPGIVNDVNNAEVVNMGEPETSPVVPEVDPVKFSRAEIDLMEQLSDLFGHTPRAINRYINIYRIIKSHKSYHITESKSQTDYVVTMFLLALIFGEPEKAQLFVDGLQSTKETNMKIFTDTLSDSGLKNIITKHINEGLLNVMTVAACKKNLYLIGRFSFRMHFTGES